MYTPKNKRKYQEIKQLQTPGEDSGVVVINIDNISKNIVPLPTQNDYNQGYFNRYFVYNLYYKKINETSQQVYNFFNTNKQTPGLEFFNIVTVRWIISNVVKQTAEFNNKKNIELLAIPELNNYINNNYSKYYRNK